MFDLHRIPLHALKKNILGVLFGFLDGFLIGWNCTGMRIIEMTFIATPSSPVILFGPANLQEDRGARGGAARCRQQPEVPGGLRREGKIVFPFLTSTYDFFGD